MLTRIFDHIYGVLRQRRWLTAAATLLLMGVCVLLSLRMHYEEDIAKFLPQSEETARYKAVYEQLTQGDKLAIVFRMKDGGGAEMADPQPIIDAMDDFSAQAESVGIEVQQFDSDAMEQRMADLYAYAPYLLRPSDYQRMDSLASQPDFVASQLAEDKALLLLPTGGMAQSVMQNDPLQLFSPLLQRLQTAAGSGQFTLIDDHVFAADGSAGLLICSTGLDGSDSQGNAQLAERLTKAREAVETAHPDVSISAIGAGLIAADNAQQIKRDSLVAMAIAVALILALLLWHYRRLSDLLWICASIGFGWLFALGMMALFRQEISLIVLGIGSVIIGIAVNYPLHFLDHLKETGDVRATLRDMTAPLLIGNITTVAAFLCLVWLDAAAMRDLGWFGSLMLVGTILFVLVVLPVFVRPHGAPAASAVEAKTIERPQRRRLGSWAIGLLVVLTGVLGWLSTRASFDADLRHINYMTAQTRADMDYLSSLNDNACAYVVGEGGTLDEALQHYADGLAAWRNDTAAALPDTIQPKSAAQWMPSAQMQAERLALWQEFWDKNRGRLLQQLQAESAAQGFRFEAFSPFVELVSQTPEPLSAETFEQLFGQTGTASVLRDADGWKVVGTLADSTLALPKATPDFYAFTSRDVSQSLVNTLQDSFNYVGWVCGLVVFFFLWLSFGSIELALLSFLPLAVGWLWILGLMVLFGVQFNIVNVILATFIFGQGDDYTIFITEGLMYEYSTGRKRLRSYRRSVLLSAVIMFIGIGTLILAKHPALRSLAQVTIIGMATVVVMACLLPPLVFRWLTRNRPSPLQNQGETAAFPQAAFAKLPITLSRLAASVAMIAVGLVLMYGMLMPLTWLRFRLAPKQNGQVGEDVKLRYHRQLQRLSGWVVRSVPWTSFRIRNGGETFSRPAVIIANHQSHLDLMCLMSLTPKLVVMTNNWAWNNPFYASIIHRADFCNASEGFEKNLAHLQERWRQGYSILVFPEGTRTADGRMGRFHKGAFWLAEQLGADILPICLHGVGHVLPKQDFMLRKAPMDLLVGQRISPQELQQMGSLLDQQKRLHALMQEQYAALSEEKETADYWAPFVKYIQKYSLSE